LKSDIENNILKSDIENNWLKLANFLEYKWYPTYIKWPSCWANVWNALIDFWIQWLPKSGRDWYKWTSILDKNINFIKKSISNPNEALAWWILVYDKWFSNNLDRKTYGHVEIKTKEGYWYGWKQKFKAWWNIIDWFVGYVYYLKEVV
jgi:hypothetical protein